MLCLCYVPRGGVAKVVLQSFVFIIKEHSSLRDVLQEGRGRGDVLFGREGPRGGEGNVVQERSQDEEGEGEERVRRGKGRARIGESIHGHH